MRNTSTLSILAIMFMTGCASQAALQYREATNGVLSLTVQEPLTPDQSASHLVVPEGFSLRIFAAEPDIQNPIAFSWDERGRLWVLESTNYPHDHVGQDSGTDRITICEDTDGDGVADQFTRFAENQPLSTAIAVVSGGALVGQAPHIVFLEDTDGDDVFDRKSRVIDNAFGTFDTHAVMNNFKYGIDNHIWSAVGYSAMYEPGYAPPVGERTNQEHMTLPMGVFRFSPDGTHLEPVGRFNNNTWGLGIAEDNTIFGSTANNNHAVVVGIPMKYEADRNVDYIQSHYLIEHTSLMPLQQVDFRDGYTAAAGAFPYAGRRYPRSYWGSLMVTEPTGHVVHTVHLEPNGSLYEEKDGAIENLLASSESWVAPVFADIGPDENIWVADWYNPVIQHNPDGRGMVNQIWNDNRGPGNAHINPLRDTEHGRIYVIEYTGREGDDLSELNPDDDEALIRGLQSSNQFWRLTAQRLIVENDRTDLVPALVELAGDPGMDETHLNAGALHALWSLHGLGKITSHVDVARAALSHDSPAVRKAAIQVMPDRPETGDALTAAGAFSDENLNTRLAAVLKVLDLGDRADESLKAAASEAREGGDVWIDAALERLYPAAEEPEAAPRTASMPEGDPGLPTAYLTINAVPSEMRFQQTRLQAYEGQPMQLAFNNLHPDLHNVVILRKGVDVAAFGQALTEYLSNPDAIDTDYIPPELQDQVIASTGILSLDESVRIVIEGLPTGEYVYLCTVPGHWEVMQGVLQIEPLS